MKKCLLSFCFFIFHSFFVFAVDYPSIADFMPHDKLLILAPHPDDEIIGTGGVIQRALRAGAQVKVVLYTNGDANEFLFIANEKRIVVKRKEFVRMGQIRYKESVAALRVLGVPEKSISVLGYPDFGTMEIFTKYWGAGRPLRAIFSRENKVPYPQAVSYSAEYRGESILRDIKNQIIEFRPNKIFVSHPVDTNRDHRALYLFTRVALWDLEKDGVAAKLYPYLIHVIGWPRPRGYRPEDKLIPFLKLQDGDILWHEFLLTRAETENKKIAILKHASQNKPTARYLLTFARKNELFGDYPDIVLKRQHDPVVCWRDVGEKKLYTRISLLKPRERAAPLAYAYCGEDLYIRMITKVPHSKNFGVNLYLIGYNKNKSFADMPKLKLYVNVSGLHVKNGRQPVFVKDIDFKYKGNQLIFKVPLRILGYPDRIMVCPSITLGNLPLDDIAWRVLRLEC